MILNPTMIMEAISFKVVESPLWFKRILSGFISSNNIVKALKQLSN